MLETKSNSLENIQFFEKLKSYFFGVISNAHDKDNKSKRFVRNKFQI